MKNDLKSLVKKNTGKLPGRPKRRIGLPVAVEQGVATSRITLISATITPASRDISPKPAWAVACLQNMPV